MEDRCNCCALWRKNVNWKLKTANRRERYPGKMSKWLKHKNNHSTPLPLFHHYTFCLLSHQPHPSFFRRITRSPIILASGFSSDIISLVREVNQCRRWVLYCYFIASAYFVLFIYLYLAFRRLTCLKCVTFLLPPSLFLHFWPVFSLCLLMKA